MLICTALISWVSSAKAIDYVPESGFTNEGGYNKSVRFLKNIMGLWMIQCIKKEYDDKYSFTDFVDELVNDGKKENLEIHVMHEDIFNLMHKI